MRWLAFANPLTWQVDLLRHHSLGLEATLALYLEAGGTVAFVLVTFFLANRTLNGPIE